MKITLDARAAVELESQFDYLLEHGAHAAALRLRARCDAFFENLLAPHPRSGKHIPEKNIWETWIPGTRLIVWYRFTSDELQIIRVWHGAQNRKNA